MSSVATNTIFNCEKQGRVRRPPLKIKFHPPLKNLLYSSVRRALKKIDAMMDSTDPYIHMLLLFTPTRK